MQELSEVNGELEGKVVFIIEIGNSFHSEGKLSMALEKYIEAWSLLPDPKEHWGISQWVAACLYSVYFDLKNYSLSKQWGEIALKLKNSEIDTSPLVDLGMVCYELGQYEECLKYFDRAYKFGKKRAFQERPEKYLNYYLDNV